MERVFELSMMDPQQFLFASVTRFEAKRDMVVARSWL
jgi:hypothetical protein